MIITDDSISIRHFAVSGEKKRFFQLCLKIPILTSVTSLPLTTQHAPASTVFELICPLSASFEVQCVCGRWTVANARSNGSQTNMAWTLDDTHQQNPTHRHSALNCFSLSFELTGQQTSLAVDWENQRPQPKQCDCHLILNWYNPKTNKV